jgi:hypothetical protein
MDALSLGLSIGGIAVSVLTFFIGWWIGSRDTRRTQSMLNALTRAVEAQGTSIEFKRDAKGLATGALLVKKELGGEHRMSGKLTTRVIRGAGKPPPPSGSA